MKKLITILMLTSSTVAFSVEDSRDIYLNKKMDIIVHGLMCGEDLNNLNRLKPSVVFTNTAEVEQGTYYYKSAYGEFSYTFTETENDAVMVRRFLKKEQTPEDKSINEFCIVKDVEGLPAPLRNYLNKTTLKASDSNRPQIMKNYELVAGKPAYGKGEY